MTSPTPRDPRLRRTQAADPLAAAVRLTMSADAMRAQQLERGTAIVTDDEPADVELAAILAAAVQGGTHEPRLTAQQFADALGPEGRESAEVADGDPADLAHDLGMAESGPSAPPVPPAAPAFSSERPRRRATWRSRHDPRSRAYGVRRPGVVDGSTPLQEMLLPTGPILDQLTAGATVREQSCCTGCGTVAAINTLWYLHPGADHGLLGIEDAETIYRRAQQLDEMPGENYDGTSVLGAMQAAVEQGLIGGYLWAFGTRDIAQTILRGHPVVIGIPWLSGMWDTGPGGLVLVQGDDEGLGHCLAVNGIMPKGPQGQPGPFFRWQQSAGESYGDHGYGYIHHRDLAALLHGRGEAAVPTLEVQEKIAA